MPFEPGKSGNPGGRPKGTPYADMLRMAVLDAAGDLTVLRKIADKHAKLALSGDMQAIREMADRLDGKAVQATTTDAHYRITVERIERQIVEPGRLLRSDELPKLELTAAPAHTDKDSSS